MRSFALVAAPILMSQRCGSATHWEWNGQINIGLPHTLSPPSLGWQVRNQNRVVELEALGADEVIDVTTEDVIARVKAITGADGEPCVTIDARSDMHCCFSGAAVRSKDPVSPWPSVMQLCVAVSS